MWPYLPLPLLKWGCEGVTIMVILSWNIAKNNCSGKVEVNLRNQNIGEKGWMVQVCLVSNFSWTTWKYDDDDVAAYVVVSVARFFFKILYFLNFIQAYVQIYTDFFPEYGFCTDFWLHLILGLYFQCSYTYSYKGKRNVPWHFEMEFVTFISSTERWKR